MFFIYFLSFLSLATTGLLHPTSALALAAPLARDTSVVSAEDISAFLIAHNTIREAHRAPPLKWSFDLATKAETWGDKCVFQRTGGVLDSKAYGELHAAGTGLFPIPAAIQQFTSDAANYNPADPTYNHWTQIVWQSTTSVGCAIAKCDNLFGPQTGQATYYVCLYDPAGNVIGQAPDNVHV